MATKVPAKSILKQQPAQPKPSDEQKAKAEQDRHNLDVALQHAYLIQHQKDVQAQILKSIETLMDLPSSSTFTTIDATRFTLLVQQFQPSDLDALVEERVIDGRCGYALCSNAPRSSALGEGAAWKLGKGGGDYCTATCAKKMLYVKTQLSEVPAWERDPTRHIPIKLHEDDRPAANTSADQVRHNARQKQIASEDLALERGEKAASLRPKQVMADRIVEKRTVTYKPLSSIDSAAVSHTAIEGYEPKRSLKFTKQDDSDDSDDEGEEDIAGHDADDAMTEALFGSVDEGTRSDGMVISMWNGKED